ncbi:MAG: ABC transporter ATP-binding protein [Ignisphaera sp.]|uniref:ATP-binding cassette domain-containing protein n=1 Tax=Ignisphaera aggregans TaxID=334771 RepID=A0A7C4JIB3_9CREN
MSEKAVEIVNFVKKFGDFVAVDNISLTIYTSEIFGLLGPNGSGKTTTLLTIATVYKPTSGDIRVYGYSVLSDGNKVRNLVGIAFQEPKALGIDKPYDLLLWHAKVVGYSSTEAKSVVKEVMDDLGLWEHRNKYFYQLSGGTRKKIEIAKILIQKPKVAIFDEPTAQVDVISKHYLWDKIRELKNEGSTIIVATNDMFEAERICERLAIIYKGKLKAVGTVKELKDSVPLGDVVELDLTAHVDSKILDILNQFGRVSASGNKVLIYVNRGEEVAVNIIDSLRRVGVKVVRIMVKEPTLDDVFFYLTGAKLKEEV